MRCLAIRKRCIDWLKPQISMVVDTYFLPDLRTPNTPTTRRRRFATGSVRVIIIIINCKCCMLNECQHQYVEHEINVQLHQHQPQPQQQQQQHQSGGIRTDPNDEEEREARWTRYFCVPNACNRLIANDEPSKFNLIWWTSWGHSGSRLV